jgi:hypothetical protein
LLGKQLLIKLNKVVVDLRVVIRNRAINQQRVKGVPSVGVGHHVKKLRAHITFPEPQTCGIFNYELKIWVISVKKHIL